MGATTHMSFAEFERMDFGADHVELLKGELIRLPPAERKRGFGSVRLFKRLDAAVERLHAEGRGQHLGEVVFEFGFLLPTDPKSWLQPDLSILAPAQPGEQYCEGAPLIAIEIVSPGDRAGEIEEKVALYLAYGSAEVWVIHPKPRSARLHYANGNSWLETKTLHSELLPGVEIALDEIL
jgi:Uma2 family endonuclease